MRKTITLLTVSSFLLAAAPMAMAGPRSQGTEELRTERHHAMYQRKLERKAEHRALKEARAYERMQRKADRHDDSDDAPTAPQTTTPTTGAIIPQ